MYDSNLIMNSLLTQTQKIQAFFHDGPFLDYDPVDEGPASRDSNAAIKAHLPWRPLLRQSAVPTVN